MNEIIQKREKWSKEEQGSHHNTTPIFFICYTQTNDSTKNRLRVQKLILSFLEALSNQVYVNIEEFLHDTE